MSVLVSLLCFRCFRGSTLSLGGPGSVIGIATAYGLDGPGTGYLYNGYRVFSGGKLWPGRYADPSPPSSAEVKK